MKRFISFFMTVVFLLGAVSAFMFSSGADGELVVKDGKRIILDYESGYIKKIDGTKTVEKLSRQFESDVIVKRDGKVLKPSDAVATNDEVSSGNTMLKALIYGDVDCDGAINTLDIISLMKRNAGWQSVSIAEAAADVNDDGIVGTDDVIMIMKYAAGWTVSLGGVDISYDTSKKQAAYEDSALNLYFANSMYKINKDNNRPTSDNSYLMKMAKNEMESCQALISSDKEYKGLSVSVTDFKNQYGDVIPAKIYWMYYYKLKLFDNVTDVIYPDALVPVIDGTTIDLKAGQNQGFMINADTSAETPAGMYKATISIYDSSKRQIKTADVYVDVWDFELPETPYSGSAFGLSKGALVANSSLSNTDEDGATELYIKYYEFLLDYKITSYGLPYSILSDEADKYMSDPRVTSFVIWGGEGYGGQYNLPDDDTVRACYNKVYSNPEWAAKSYFYLVDEPAGDGWLKVESEYNRLKGILGTDDFWFCVPLAQDQELKINGVGMDGYEFTRNFINMNVPQSHAFDVKNGMFNSKRFQHVYGYDEFPIRYQEDRKIGDKMWWYICISPQPPYPNLFVSYQGVVYRDVMWQQFMFDIDGILYWAVNVWESNSVNRIVDMGDGLLMYPGKWFGVGDVVCPSIRLENLRDGFEDFDYLRMAEKIYGRDTILDIVHKVTTDVLEYTEDYRTLQRQRDLLGNMLEEALGD